MNGLMVSTIIAVSPVVIVFLLSLFYAYCAWNERRRK